jgi:hypothetical protein
MEMFKKRLITQSYYAPVAQLGYWKQPNRATLSYFNEEERRRPRVRILSDEVIWLSSLDEFPSRRVFYFSLAFHFKKRRHLISSPITHPMVRQSRRFMLISPIVFLCELYIHIIFLRI